MRITRQLNHLETLREVEKFAIANDNVVCADGSFEEVILEVMIEDGD